jgi:hypothetical protein
MHDVPYSQSATALMNPYRVSRFCSAYLRLSANGPGAGRLRIRTPLPVLDLKIADRDGITTGEDAF